MRKLIDLKESYDGDLVLTDDGDFADTQDKYDLAIFQIIRTIVNTKPGEFALYPNLGFQSDIYEGQRNTRELGERVAKAVKDAIIQNTIFYEHELEVVPVPVGKNTIALRITILNNQEKHRYAIAYDTKENMILSLVTEDGQEIQEPIQVVLPPTSKS